MFTYGVGWGLASLVGIQTRDRLSPIENDDHAPPPGKAMYPKANPSPSPFFNFSKITIFKSFVNGFQKPFLQCASFPTVRRKSQCSPK
jgi:hypothetical protein